MKTTKSFLQKMIRLANGEQIPKSSLNADAMRQMVDDGAVVTIAHGAKGRYAAKDPTLFRQYLNNLYHTGDIEALAEMLGKKEASRAEQVKLAGNSKLKRKRTFKGFLVNCYEPIRATLGGKAVTIDPEPGTFTFVYDFEDFRIPADTVVFGVENSENFRFVEKQKRLFDQFLQPGEKALFVNRYPTSQTKDLRKWLMGMPNRYVHFGDLDLKGVEIYLSSFFAYLGERASFLIPDDAEERIKKGEGGRYDTQYKPNKGKARDPRVQPLIDLIHKHHKGYDQEGFIE